MPGNDFAHCGDGVSGFQKFLLRGNVVALAAAVIIGAAFGSVVKAFVTDIITPLIGVFGAVPDFSALYFEINRSRFMIGDSLTMSFQQCPFVCHPGGHCLFLRRDAR